MSDDERQAHRAFDTRDGRGRQANAHKDDFQGSGILFEQAMAQTRMAICLSDPRQDDTPIVFANRAFCELTGYPQDEVIGQNCRFLQGKDTNREQVARIRDAIEKEDVVVVELLNYRKDGTSFWNALHIGPVYDPDGELLYYFGSQWDVTDVHAARADERHAKAMARELSHRVKNMFSIIGGIVTLTGRSRGVSKEAALINERIQALGRAYETTLDEASEGTIEVGQAIRAVLSPYDPEGDRIVYEGNGVRIDPNAVSTIGLTLHELATNATKYGALGVDGGTVTVDWFETGEDVFGMSWTERGGPRVTGPPACEGMGTSIVDMLLKASGGELARDWRDDGLRAVLTIPSEG